MRPEDILSHWDSGTLWPARCGLDLATGYERALSVRELRIARGEKPVGFKVGFTNRNIWPVYQVFGPVWGPMWDTTVVFCEGEGELSLASTCQPRLEPEAVFGMKATPPANASLDELLACVAWVGPGFEVVQSHLPDWKFAAPDTAADGALHARLLVGAKVAVERFGSDAATFDRALAASRVVLKHEGKAVEEGAGANVLDGPLHALGHFLHELRAFPGAPDLQPGDVVTTGTWTDAWPVAPGQRWTAEFDPALGRLSVKFR